MPADYTSTARALALPVESARSPSPSFLRPPWNPPRRSNSTAGSRSIYSSHTRIRSTSLRDNVINNAEKAARRINATFMKLSLLQRILVVIAAVVLNVLLILFLIFNEKIFTKLAPLSERWKDTTGGWTILWAMVFATAFPPIIGYGMCGTIAGFVYGVWEGWFIYASATVAGSFCSFLVSRTVLRKYVERLVKNDKRFAALTLTLKHDGLKLLCMIRLCPLPYSISNGAISTFPTVHPVMYALATALVSPKLLIHVFIGSRLGAIGKSGEKMTAGTKALNWLSIIFGVVVGFTTGVYIYRRTTARAKELEAEERATVHRHGGIPRPEFHDDPEAQIAASTIANRESPGTGTFDNDDAPDYFDSELASPNPNDTKQADQESYRDEFTDDEDPDDVFGRGDGDEEETIGLHKARSEGGGRLSR